jgi:mono/diheme cytochrome c family protein
MQMGRKNTMAALAAHSFLIGLVALFALAPGSARADDAAVERGKYLVTIGICQACHLKNLAGGRRTGGNISANITPDRETGIGAWTDEQIIEAIRNGKRPDGSRVRPSMGVFWYHDLADTDVRAIVAYLRSMPPVHAKHERSADPGRLPVLRPPVDSVPDVPRTDKVAYGRYLTSAVAHCMTCHTPRGEGQPDLSRPGAGGNTTNVPGGGVALSANLTPGNPNGVAKWTDEQVKQAITKGVRPDGSKLIPVMDFELYEHFTSEDLDAIIAYLRSLKPEPSSQGVRER